MDFAQLSGIYKINKINKINNQLNNVLQGKDRSSFSGLHNENFIWVPQAKRLSTSRFIILC